MRLTPSTVVLALSFVIHPATSSAQMSPARAVVEYKVLATTRTSTMEKELNAAGEQGYRLQAVMGGETAAGGKEAVAIVARLESTRARFQYRLLATNRTSTMQKEMQNAADAGYTYKDQTVFDTLTGGREVVVLMERDSEHPAKGDIYRLLATSKTSTMEKELAAAGVDGYVALGMTVGKTITGGREIVTITRRRTP